MRFWKSHSSGAEVPAQPAPAPESVEDKKGKQMREAADIISDWYAQKTAESKDALFVSPTAKPERDFRNEFLQAVSWLQPFEKESVLALVKDSANRKLSREAIKQWLDYLNNKQ